MQLCQHSLVIWPWRCKPYSESNCHHLEHWKENVFLSARWFPCFLCSRAQPSSQASKHVRPLRRRKHRNRSRSSSSSGRRRKHLCRLLCWWLSPYVLLPAHIKLNVSLCFLCNSQFLLQLLYYMNRFMLLTMHIGQAMALARCSNLALHTN